MEDLEEEEKDACNICQLDGCTLPAEKGRKFWSKRHFHAAQHKQRRKSTENAAGVLWCLTLAAQAVASDALFGDDRHALCSLTLTLAGSSSSQFSMSSRLPA